MTLNFISPKEFKPSYNDIVRTHIRTLEEAIQDCLDYDIRSTELYNALDYFKNNCPRGVRLFHEGLEMRDWTIGQAYMIEGLKNIKGRVCCNS